MVAGHCATAAGITAAALDLTTAYARVREQFGKPIAAFQAVAQRAADAFIDVKAIRLTALQACWRVASGLPAGEQVAVAKFWAADGGKRVMHAAQHIHGGIGVDKDYPLHRLFLAYTADRAESGRSDRAPAPDRRRARPRSGLTWRPRRSERHSGRRHFRPGSAART